MRDVVTCLDDDIVGSGGPVADGADWIVEPHDVLPWRSGRLPHRRPPSDSARKGSRACMGLAAISPAAASPRPSRPSSSRWGRAAGCYGSPVEPRAVVAIELHGDALDAVGAALHDAGRVEADHLDPRRLERLDGDPRLARYDHDARFDDHQVGGHEAMVLLGRDLDEREAEL